MKIWSLVGLLVASLCLSLGFTPALADESVQVTVGDVVAGEPEAKEATFEVQPPKHENLEELVTASTTFVKEPRLVYGKSVDYLIKVTNNSSQNVFVVGIQPSYPGRDKITFNPVRNIQSVGASNSEEIKGSFTCELDVTKVDFALHVLVFNSADQAKPYRIQAFSGNLPVHRPGNNWFDMQSIGIYVMVAVVGYFSYIWFSSRKTTTSSAASRANRERRAKEKRVSSEPQSPDTEWIPKHHLQIGQPKLRTTSASTSEQASTSSLSLLSDSSPGSEDESSKQRQK